VAYALLAYVAWGLFPAYWKLLAGVAPAEVVAHRVLWSFLFVGALLTLKGRWGEYLRVVRSGRTVAALAASAALITGNWLLYIWSVKAGRVVEASLGYYINPLGNVLLARLVLGERLRPLQWAAVALAAVGVVNLAVGVGVVPWVSLALAASFALYGLVRKTAPVESLTGLAVETSLAVPFALLFLALGPYAAEGRVMGAGLRESLLLAGSGAATALPLLWFAHAARRLRYSSLGLFQYIAPTLTLGLAVFLFGEHFTPRHGVTFSLIWGAVGLYLLDTWRAGRAAPAPAVPAPAVPAPAVPAPAVPVPAVPSATDGRPG
jgi:chloramphenicol-sensitive protein RarD